MLLLFVEPKFYTFLLVLSVELRNFVLSYTTCMGIYISVSKRIQCLKYLTENRAITQEYSVS